MQKFLIATFLGVLAYFLTLPLFTSVQASLIGVLTLLVTLWTNEGLNLGVVSLLPLVLFPIFGILDFNSVTPNYSKTIIFLFMGGFLLAMGMEKTGTDRRIAHLVLSIFPKSFLGVLYALSITSGLMSGLLSNTTVTILLVPIALYLSDRAEIQFRLVLAVAYGATVGGILTPIGTPPNLIFLGFAENMGLSTPTFIEWILKLLPVVLVMMTILPLILAIGVKNFEIQNSGEKIVFDRNQKIILSILGVLVLTLFGNSILKELNEKLLIFSAGLLLFLPKIDTVPDEVVEEKIAKLQDANWEKKPKFILPISSVTNRNIDRLKFSLYDIVENQN